MGGVDLTGIYRRCSFNYKLLRFRSMSLVDKAGHSVQ